MCPDAELLSAWSDGEVPSPWKERISEHLHGCAACSGKVAEFRRLSMRLRSAEGFDEAAVVARVASRLGLEEGDGAGQKNSRFVVVRPGPRRLAIPMPAAAAAAAVLIAFGAFSGRMLPLAGTLASAAPAENLAVPTAAAATSGSPTMDSLVRYIEAQNAPLSMTIQLPSHAAYTEGGVPMIVKTPPAETVSLPPANSGLGFVMTGEGN